MSHLTPPPDPDSVVNAWQRLRFALGAAGIGTWHLDLRTRSLITCAMLIPMRANSELEIHFPAAIRNGATIADIEELIYQSAGYAGFPAATNARDVARKSLKAAGMVD